ncbi:MAG: helix-turn-helix domain-containing protein [Prevotella sp.]|jgi:DNA-binding response OmpR family regulator|nr:helix-turn-helix domain-containing protein [Prevotella sp.]
MKTEINFEIKKNENEKFEVVNPSNNDFLPASLMYVIIDAVDKAVKKYNKEHSLQVEQIDVPPVIAITSELTYDSKRHILYVQGNVIQLTTKEAELFQLLALNIDNVVERKDALMKIWADDNYFNARSMDVYITKLRKLIKPVPDVEIINHHGKGYSLQVNEKLISQ